MKSFYSPKAEEMYGASVWLTPAGGEAKITCTGDIPAPHAYQWEDAVEVEVIRHLRNVGNGSAPRTRTYFGYERPAAEGTA